jgi:hypothetical protein
MAKFPREAKVMKRLVLIVLIAGMVNTGTALAQNKIMQAGERFHGIRDYREVMPGVLYRGGANNGRAPLRQSQLEALCDAGMGTAYYLYSTGLHGPSVTHCSKGDLDYSYESWEGKGRARIDQQIYNTIKSKGKPVFIHCWNGIHATGAVAATALMQFCGISAKQAVDYWKVGIAPKVQYPSVIRNIQSFQPNPKLELTPEEQATYCPKFGTPDNHP